MASTVTMSSLENLCASWHRSQVNEYTRAPWCTIKWTYGPWKDLFKSVWNFWWPHLYRWVANYIRSCEQCQRIKPALSSNAPLKPLPIPTDCWKSVSLDFMFGLPPDHKGRTGLVVFVDRLSKMVHLAPCKTSITGKEAALLFLEHVYRRHGMP